MEIGYRVHLLLYSYVVMNVKVVCGNVHAFTERTNDLLWHRMGKGVYRVTPTHSIDSRILRSTHLQQCTTYVCGLRSDWLHHVFIAAKIQSHKSTFYMYNECATKENERFTFLGNRIIHILLQSIFFCQMLQPYRCNFSFSQKSHVERMHTLCMCMCNMHLYMDWNFFISFIRNILYLRGAKIALIYVTWFRLISFPHHIKFHMSFEMRTTWAHSFVHAHFCDLYCITFAFFTLTLSAYIARGSSQSTRQTYRHTFSH